MGKYNFDEEIDRHNTNSLKWDFNKERNKPEDLLPFWVADMDFKLPDEITFDLISKAKEGIFGYSEPKDEYYNELINWNKKHYEIDILKENIIVSPSVVFSICTLIKILTKENDSIIINEPVYYPFKESILVNNRKVVVSDLILNNEKYEIDFIDFETKIKENNVKLYILCNPHNPVGRVWQKDELDQIVKICNKYNVFIISDEIHSDFVYNTTFYSIGRYNFENYAIVSGPTKTFNMPGLKISHVVIKNKKVYSEFLREFDRIGYSQQSIMGIVGTVSAYNKGENWLNEVKSYIYNNIIYIDNYLKNNLPKIKLIKPEGTYLLWLDFRDLKLSDKKINDLIINKSKLWLDSGLIFGQSGRGFQRINVATNRKNINILLERLTKTFKDF